MRWFKHLSDARRNPKMRLLENELGEAGYARFFKLLEVIAQYGDDGKRFAPKLDLRDRRTNPHWLAAELGIAAKLIEKTLGVLARAGLIDSKAWRQRTIHVPAMLEYRDDWTRRSHSVATTELQPSRTGGARERHRSHSVVTPQPKNKKKEEQEQDLPKRTADVDSSAQKAAVRHFVDNQKDRDDPTPAQLRSNSEVTTEQLRSELARIGKTHGVESTNGSKEAKFLAAGIDRRRLFAFFDDTRIEAQRKGEPEDLEALTVATAGECVKLLFSERGAVELRGLEESLVYAAVVPKVRAAVPVISQVKDYEKRKHQLGGYIINAVVAAALELKGKQC